MRHLEIAEGAPAQVVALTRRELHAVRALTLLDISPTADPEQWELRAGRRIGVARAGGLQVTIAPKVSISRLIFMLGYSARAGWSAEEVLSTLR